MGLSGISVIGGKMVYRHMTLKLQKEHPDQYAIHKMFAWNKMLSDRMKPKKWNKPNKNGTGVSFEMMMSKEEVVSSYAELESYVKIVNEEYGTDYILTKQEEKPVKAEK